MCLLTDNITNRVGAYKFFQATMCQRLGIPEIVSAATIVVQDMKDVKNTAL